MKATFVDDVDCKERKQTLVLLVVFGTTHSDDQVKNGNCKDHRPVTPARHCAHKQTQEEKREIRARITPSGKVIIDRLSQQKSTS